jgi:FkbM family methyltransferase
VNFLRFERSDLGHDLASGYANLSVRGFYSQGRGKLAMGGAERLLRLMEACIGRRALWRLGRSAYFLARRDVGNQMATNGERTLQRNICAATVAPAIIFDVGANIGAWSKSLLEVAGGQSVRLYAFEPTPDSRARLSSTLQGSGAFVRAEALTDQVGTTRFELHGPTSGINSIASENSTGVVIEVPTNTVDALSKAEGLDRIDLLKIDAEGFDLSVLRGARDMLARGAIGVAQFEYNWRWVHNRAFLHDVFALASGTPYRIGKLVAEGVEIYERWHPELERFVEGNYVLVHPHMIPHVGARFGRFDISNTYAT